MDHLTLLEGADFIRWSQVQGRTDYVRKVHFDHLRHWWRRMVDVFPGHIVPGGRMPNPARLGHSTDEVPGMPGVTVADLGEFAEVINRISRQGGLPAPFDLHDTPWQ